MRASNGRAQLQEAVELAHESLTWEVLTEMTMLSLDLFFLKNSLFLVVLGLCCYEGFSLFAETGNHSHCSCWALGLSLSSYGSRA